jgi:hypothetical protein
MQRRGGKAEPVDSGCRGGSPAAHCGTRAPPAPVMLVGALDSAGKTRGAITRVPQRPWRGQRRALTTTGDGRTARERATQVTATQVSGAGSDGAWRSWR